MGKIILRYSGESVRPTHILSNGRMRLFNAMANAMQSGFSALVLAVTRASYRRSNSSRELKRGGAYIDWKKSEPPTLIGAKIYEGPFWEKLAKKEGKKDGS